MRRVVEIENGGTFDRDRRRRTFKWELVENNPASHSENKPQQGTLSTKKWHIFGDFNKI